ncbi:MAG: 1-deoxy-D-xylulose-5-phosphate reductoisomerase [Chitinispirillaceae bacterium]|nr:1-deoxy-D-xylulose-5-phosphate reductoisomerase [Chitinispirillaceae bacterium]
MKTKKNLKVIVLGSTGSIGRGTLNCIRRYSDKFCVTGLAAGSNIEILLKQISEFKPQKVYIAESKYIPYIKKEFGGKIECIETDEGPEALVKETESDIVVNGLVGAIGLRPTISALHKKNRVALANKESMVIGGELINRLLAEGNGEIIPVDSEHSAIFQCLKGNSISAIGSIILTASGGPFRKLPLEKFHEITPEDALKHPTWSMGKKITIDSATLMNKGFEIIEAHQLFKVPYENIKVLIHPQSIIHSMVEFFDGSILAQLGCPDMELPIQYALSYPERLPINCFRLSLSEVGKLEFMEPDYDKFPSLKLCIDAGIKGGTAPVILNAANEVAVELFLKGSIKFTQIPEIVEEALKQNKTEPIKNLETIEKCDKKIRQWVKEFISKKGVL